MPAVSERQRKFMVDQFMAISYATRHERYRISVHGGDCGRRRQHHRVV